MMKLYNSIHAKSTSSRKANTGKPGSTAQARIIREGALNQARRSPILDAARAAFSSLGWMVQFEGDRKTGGLHAGAIYSYFA